MFQEQKINREPHLISGVAPTFSHTTQTKGHDGQYIQIASLISWSINIDLWSLQVHISNFITVCPYNKWGGEKAGAGKFETFKVLLLTQNSQLWSSKVT